MHTDPIADMLTRIRNASLAGHDSVEMPFSNIKEQIALVIKEAGYVTDVSTKDVDGRKMLTIGLNGKVINLKRVSTPGQRIYKKSKEIYSLKKGYGLSIITTPQGIMTDKQAREKKLGGEIICQIY